MVHQTVSKTEPVEINTIAMEFSPQFDELGEFFLLFGEESLVGCTRKATVTTSLNEFTPSL